MSGCHFKQEQQTSLAVHLHGMHSPFPQIHACPHPEPQNMCLTTPSATCAGFGYHAYGLAGWPRRSRQIFLAEDGSYIRTYKRLSEEGDFDIVDEETFLISSTGLVNTTGSADNTGPGNFTSQTVLGCGDYGRWVHQKLVVYSGILQQY